MGNCASVGKESCVEPPKPSLVKQNDNGRAPSFRTIKDTFESVEEVSHALRQAGLESSELILALDLTKSNEWSGKASFQSMLQANCRQVHVAGVSAQTWHFQRILHYNYMFFWWLSVWFVHSAFGAQWFPRFFWDLCDSCFLALQVLLFFLMHF
jgi:hypothetical protein